MEIKVILKKLTSDEEFKNWKKSHKEYYLVHIFKMVDEANKDMWQIGFYSKETDKITTFVLEKDCIKIIPETDIFREEEHTIKELDMNKIKVDLNEALDKAQKLHNKEYKAEQLFKAIAILQHLESQIWNITFVTRSFKTLNIKINAETGNIESHDLKSLINIQQ